MRKDVGWRKALGTGVATGGIELESPRLHPGGVYTKTFQRDKKRGLQVVYRGVKDLLRLKNLDRKSHAEQLLRAGPRLTRSRC